MDEQLLRSGDCNLKHVTKTSTRTHKVSVMPSNTFQISSDALFAEHNRNVSGDDVIDVSWLPYDGIYDVINVWFLVMEVVTSSTSPGSLVMVLDAVLVHECFQSLDNSLCKKQIKNINDVITLRYLSLHDITLR